MGYLLSRRHSLLMMMMMMTRSSACWQEAIEQKTILPLNVIRHFDSHGDVSEIATTEDTGVSESDVSFETSFAVPTYLASSTDFHSYETE